MFEFFLGAYFGVGAVYAYDTAMNAHEVLESAREDGFDESALDPFVPYISAIALFFLWLPAQVYHNYVMGKDNEKELTK